MKLTGDKADYVRKHAPDSCKLYIICKGKLVDLKGHGDQGNQEALITSKIYSRIKGFEGKNTLEMEIECNSIKFVLIHSGEIGMIFYFLVKNIK